MSARTLPRYADQTRALLWLQLIINMVGILFLVFMVVNFQSALPDDGGIYMLAVLGGLFLGGVQSAAAAKLFPRGWAAAWILAFNAQVLTIVAVWASWQMLFMIGVGVLYTLGMVGWISLNLFRPEVRRYCFSRSADG